jgi:hypothetical protein
MRLVAIAALFVASIPAAVLGQTPSDQLPASFVKNLKPRLVHGNSSADGGGVLGKRSSGNVLGVDTVANWSSYFYIPGANSFGGLQFTWPYTMVGHAPFGQGHDSDWNGQTTYINAPVVAVSLDLRNADGTPRYVNGQRLYSDATQYIPYVLASPVFSPNRYDSSERPTQFTDAIQRAEFFNKADDDWHTLLRPRVVTPRTMVLLRGTYYFALNDDGTCCLYVLIDEGTFGNALFPSTPNDTTTPIGAAENAGEFRTKDIGSFVFPNAYLYENGDPNDCCVLGFHSYDVEPGDKSNGFQERRYVMNYNSWVTAGLFGPFFSDITPLSHEMTETFNDPFGGNATPWWLAPNGLCQNTLETGDVIEGLSNSAYPITSNGFTWHPQNEALIQWFASLQKSDAIHRAYSYPDITVLTTPNVPQNPGCTPPVN